MKKIFSWFRTTMVFGLASILPIVLLAWVLYQIYSFIIEQVKPIAKVLSISVHIDIILASLITVGLMILLCFLLGVIVRTRLGRFFHNQVEKRILKRIPGYSVTKEVVLHFSGEQETPFSSVVLCRPFGGPSWMTGFVTDRYRSAGIITIFVPTGPNPTSGNIFHVPKDQVVELDAKVEQGIKSVIGCGAGSSLLLEGVDLVPRSAARS